MEDSLPSEESGSASSNNEDTSARGFAAGLVPRFLNPFLDGASLHCWVNVDVSLVQPWGAVVSVILPPMDASLRGIAEEVAVWTASKCLYPRMVM